MTELLYSPKIKPEHLARKAIVYLRQSTEKQVRQNQENQRLQYDLGERMHALGWSEVEIIAHDLGASAAIGAARREGFERVLSSVALGEVGIVVSREVSRLSRTDKDWCRLVEVCQIFGTLIGVEPQVYDLNYLDDQLVLGIKGTLSVVELKVLRQRMQAGQESKARRGELFKRLPVGYVQDGLGRRASGESDPWDAHHLEDSVAEPDPRHAPQPLLRRRLCVGPPSRRDRDGGGPVGEAAGLDASRDGVPGLSSRSSRGVY